jgi:AcrR family transcriptional regulator
MAVSTDSSGSRKRNARGEGQALRGDIVSAARAILIEEGYESAVTLRGVARQVGIAPQSIYRHFATPEDIVQAVTIETFRELGRYIAAAKEGITVPRDRLITGCRAYMAFGIENPNLYGLLFSRNRLLRGEEAAPATVGEPDRRNPDQGSFGYLMADLRLCVGDGTSEATDVLSTAVQLWAAMHGFIMLRGNGYQFPWPDLARVEIELVSSIAKFREAAPTAPSALSSPSQTRPPPPPMLG